MRGARRRLDRVGRGAKEHGGLEWRGSKDGAPTDDRTAAAGSAITIVVLIVILLLLIVVFKT